MADEHPHVALVRRLWDAVARGDADALTELYAPDAVLRAYGRNPIAGEFKGIAAILDYFARAGENVEDLRSEILAVYTSDAGAVIRYRTVATRGPKHLDLQSLYVLAIENGRVVEASLAPMDQHQNDAFWRVE
jgi:ketosteroid isomerase-like protein